MKNNSNYNLSIQIFRTSICLVLLADIIFFVPHAISIFGPESFLDYGIFQKNLNDQSLNLPLFSQNFKSKINVNILFAITLIALMLYLFGYFKTFSGILVLILIALLKARNPYLLNGSGTVIMVTLPFVILSELPAYNNTWVVALKKWGVYAIRIQVCIIYFFAGFSKIFCDVWLDGSAFYYMLSVYQFNALPFLNNMLAQCKLFVWATTYLFLGWELLFPILVIFKPVRYVTLIAGVFFHVGSYVLMRIDDFPWIMIGSYSAFLSDKELLRLLAPIKTQTKKVFEGIKFFVA